jgi:membrane protein insertase Oxa1/YidC/SpoIIIJ
VVVNELEEVGPVVESQAGAWTPHIVDADVLIGVSKGQATAVAALQKVDPYITASQFREFLEVETESQQTQLAQLLIDNGVKPLSTAFGQLGQNSQLSDLFWRIATTRGTGDAAMVIHSITSGYPILTQDNKLAHTVQLTLRIAGVVFNVVRKN